MILRMQSRKAHACAAHSSHYTNSFCILITSNSSFELSSDDGGSVSVGAALISWTALISSDDDASVCAGADAAAAGAAGAAGAALISWTALISLGDAGVGGVVAEVVLLQLDKDWVEAVDEVFVAAVAADVAADDVG